jgi:PAS domain S-box-containing protein
MINFPKNFKLMIYEQKSVKNSLVDNCELHQMIIDALSLPVFYRNKDGIFQTCNTAFERFTGMERRDMIGKTFYDFQPEDIAEIYAKKDNDLFESPGDQVYETRIKVGDGTFRDVVIQKALIRNEAGEDIGILGSVFDVTERKKSEQKLERAKESMVISSHMLHKINAGIIIVNSDFKVIDSNESFARLMGEETVELFETIPGLRGADILELVPEVIYKMISSIMTTGESNLDRDLKYQNRLLQVSVVTIYKQRVVGAVIRDLSAPVLVREEIISRAQRVNKQNIETVQKIAFLLGENAAQTEEMINSIIESYSYSDDK